MPERWTVPDGKGGYRPMNNDEGEPLHPLNMGLRLAEIKAEGAPTGYPAPPPRKAPPLWRVHLGRWLERLADRVCPRYDRDGGW